MEITIINPKADTGCETAIPAKNELKEEHRKKRIAFLFDLDGVIVDSETEYTKFWSGVDRMFPTGVENFSRKIKGTTLTNILNTYFPDPQVQEEICALLDKQERDMVYRLKPGVEKLLVTIKETGYPAIMVTSSNDMKMAHLWEQLPGLRSMFTHIVTADMVSRSKPDPQGYLIGADLAGAKPENCAVFEDSRQGVEAGRHSGAFVVGVAGTLPVEDIEPFCDVVVDTLENFDVAALVEILEKR